MATPKQSLDSLPFNFQDYFEKWTAELKHYLTELESATNTTPPPPFTATGLVSQVIRHYEEYYKVKSYLLQEDVFLLLSPPWIGGWRPTLAFDLLYSKSGIQLESWLEHFLASDGSYAPVDDLGGVTLAQLNIIHTLENKTVYEEREISEKMAKQQETLANTEMVQLTHADFVEFFLKPKKEGLRKIIGRADELRLTTLKQVTGILTPNQALHFLIAVAELQLRLHDFGKQHDQKELAQPNNHG